MLNAESVKSRFLMASLQAQAFTGELTSNWHERQKDVLEIEARIRDEALRARGITAGTVVPIEEVEAAYTRRDDGAYAELSKEQHMVLEAIERAYSGSIYPKWFNAEEIANHLQGPLRGNRYAVEGHLSVLAARGLVIAVSREEESPSTGEIVFGNAYRLPLAEFKPPEGDSRDPVEGDDGRMREMERLIRQLEKGRM